MSKPANNTTPATNTNKPSGFIPKQSPQSAAKVRSESHDRLDPKKR